MILSALVTAPAGQWWQMRPWTLQQAHARVKKLALNHLQPRGKAPRMQSASTPTSPEREATSLRPVSLA